MLSETLAGEDDSTSSYAYNPFTDDNTGPAETHKSAQSRFAIPILDFPPGPTDLLPLHLGLWFVSCPPARLYSVGPHFSRGHLCSGVQNQTVKAD